MKAGAKVSIVSFQDGNAIKVPDSVVIAGCDSYSDKKKSIRQELKRIHPDIVICDTPLSVLLSVGKGHKTLYDITEWYPSKKNLGKLVSPDDAESISNAIGEYLSDYSHYHQHAQQALRLYNEKYNWEQKEGSFLEFVKRFAG